MENTDKFINKKLNSTQAVILNNLRETSLGPAIEGIKAVVGAGKMLRPRLIFRLGIATGVQEDILVRTAACVEMLHGASLLHDDVIDGGLIRRNLPSFWVQHGASGAILLGDLLVCRAFELIAETENINFIKVFSSMMREVCESEAEQELVPQHGGNAWEKCVFLARHKTGALFALSAYPCGGDDYDLCLALQEAGYMLGTAYQLADDLLDAYQDPDESDKTLGTDAREGKLTAAAVWEKEGVNPVKNIEKLCDSSLEMLSSWPHVQDALNDYIVNDLQPIMKKFTKGFSKVSKI